MQCCQVAFFNTSLLLQTGGASFSYCLWPIFVYCLACVDVMALLSGWHVLQSLNLRTWRIFLATLVERRTCVRVKRRDGGKSLEWGSPIFSFPQSIPESGTGNNFKFSIILGNREKSWKPQSWRTSAAQEMAPPPQPRPTPGCPSGTSGLTWLPHVLASWFDWITNSGQKAVFFSTPVNSGSERAQDAETKRA